MPVLISFELNPDVIAATEISGYIDRIPVVVALSEASTDEVTVSYRLQPGTALAGSDFYADTGTLVFAPGETTKTILVRAVHNVTPEVDEALFVELFNPVGGSFFGTAPVLRETVFILDDDAVGLQRGLFVSSPMLVEGDAGARQAVFEITLSRPSATQLTFSYTTRNDTATAGQDYAARSGTITFQPGQTEATVTVPVYGDTTLEASEGFFLIVTPTAALDDDGAGAVGTATILDDDAGGNALPTISLAGGSGLETSAYIDRMPFVVTLSQPSDDSVTVAYRVQAGTALVGVDVYDTSGTITFAPGETSQTIFVRGYHNVDDEPDEAFVLELFDPAGAQFAGDAPVLRETGFILDDDEEGLTRSVFVSRPVTEENDDGGGAVVFFIRISRPFAEATTLNYSTADGTARAGQDYVATSGSVTFAPGQTVASVRVQLRGDTAYEPGETFLLTLTGTLPSTLVSLPGGRTGTATILDNDIGGTSGPDRLQGTPQSEAIHGFGGNDTLIGLRGDDLLNGGHGRDTAIYLGATPAVVDLRLAGAQDTGHGEDRLIAIENVTAGSGNDVLTGNDAANTLIGNGGNDRLTGHGGNDQLQGDVGNDRLDGGAGSDTAVFTGTTAVRLNLTLTGPQATGHGTDTLLRIENAIAGSGADVLRGNAAANAFVGNEGDDQLFGAGGADRLTGNNGIDRLDGGTGDDVLTGGLDGDRFIFRTGSGRDVIRDFQNGQDRLVILSGADSFADVVVTDSGPHAVIRFGNVRITLLETNHTAIGAEDFLFQ